MFKLRDFHF